MILSFHTKLRQAKPENYTAEGDFAPRHKELTSSVTTFRLLTLAACGMACLVSLLPAAGHDQMWLLYGARLVLHGAQLYGPQVFETNPPMIFWLSMLPTAAAGWLHLPETAMGKLVVVGLECAVAWTCIHIAARTHATLADFKLSSLGR